MTQEQILAYNLYRVRVLLKVSHPVLAQRLGVPKAIIGLCTTEQRDCILNEVMIP